MALDIETGAGSPTANSFVTDVEFVAWLTVRGRIAAVNALAATAPDREPALVLAFDYLRNEQRFRYRGIRASATQAAPWPRVGASERGGLVIPIATVPWRVKDAQCAAAYQIIIGGDLQPPITDGGKIQSETVGPISVSYFEGGSPETIYPEVLGMLVPLLWGDQYAAMIALPYITAPVAVTGFNNEFLPPAPSPAASNSGLIDPLLLDG